MAVYAKKSSRSLASCLDITASARLAWYRGFTSYSTRFFQAVQARVVVWIQRNWHGSEGLPLREWGMCICGRKAFKSMFMFSKINLY